MLLLQYMGYKTNQWNISFGYLLIYWFMVIRVLFYICWGHHSWRSWWSRRQESGYHNSWCMDTLGGWPFWTGPWDLSVLLFKLFLVKKKKFPVVGWLSTNAGLWGFLNYQISYYKWNIAVLVSIYAVKRSYLWSTIFGYIH